MTTARRIVCDVDGVRTVRFEYGPDRPRNVLALHGLHGTHHGLDPIASRIRNATVVVPDLPGFGDSAPFADRTHDVAGYARWAATLVDEMGGDPVLLGHSFGSSVAAAVATIRPRLAGLVLVNPIVQPAVVEAGAAGAAARASLAAHRLLAAAGRPGDTVLRHRTVADLATLTMATTRDRSLRRWIRAEHRARFGRFATPSTLLEAVAAASTDGVGRHAPGHLPPTLLLGGARDRIAPLPRLRALAAALPTAHLDVAADVGHLVHYEAPEWAARRVDVFLAHPRGSAPVAGPPDRP